ALDDSPEGGVRGGAGGRALEAVAEELVAAAGGGRGRRGVWRRVAGWRLGHGLLRRRGFAGGTGVFTRDIRRLGGLEAGAAGAVGFARRHAGAAGAGAGRVCVRVEPDGGRTDLLGTGAARGAAGGRAGAARRRRRRRDAGRARVRRGVRGIGWIAGGGSLRRDATRDAGADRAHELGRSVRLFAVDGRAACGAGGGERSERHEPGAANGTTSGELGRQRVLASREGERLGHARP